MRLQLQNANRSHAQSGLPQLHGPSPGTVQCSQSAPYHPTGCSHASAGAGWSVRAHLHSITLMPRTGTSALPARQPAVPANDGTELAHDIGLHHCTRKVPNFASRGGRPRRPRLARSAPTLTASHHAADSARAPRRMPSSLSSCAARHLTTTRSFQQPAPTPCALPALAAGSAWAGAGTPVRRPGMRRAALRQCTAPSRHQRAARRRGRAPRATARPRPRTRRSHVPALRLAEQVAAMPTAWRGQAAAPAVRGERAPRDGRHLAQQLRAQHQLLLHQAVHAALARQVPHEVLLVALQRLARARPAPARQCPRPQRLTLQVGDRARPPIGCLIHSACGG
jgi:hypothetical protein